MAKIPSRADRGAVYVALLRGVNVGGKNTVSMRALRQSFEALGLRDVRTYINSGNVLFRSAKSSARALERDIDRLLAGHGLASKAVVRSAAEMDRLVKTIDREWTPDARWKRNVIFLRRAIDSRRLLDRLPPRKPDIERVVYCPGALLWSGLVSQLTRTTMLKLAGQPAYQDMTIRGVTTTRTLRDLMQQAQAPVSFRS